MFNKVDNFSQNDRVKTVLQIIFEIAIFLYSQLLKLSKDWISKVNVPATRRCIKYDTRLPRNWQTSIPWQLQFETTDVRERCLECRRYLWKHRLRNVVLPRR